MVFQGRLNNAWRRSFKVSHLSYTLLYPISMRSCSKGSRGLSVPLRVSGIFTATTISPSSWLRQCPDRYTIRAGRNLPDKEFRYLRTVIVTAAVYWGFSSMLRSKLTPSLTFQHRAGVRPYTSSFDLAESCVFDKQSLGPFHCGLLLSRRPFSRSYGAILPSSLAMNHSSALGYSPRLPVSVYGTGCISLELFLEVRHIITSPEGSVYYPIDALPSRLQRTIPSVRSITSPSPLLRMQVQEY